MNKEKIHFLAFLLILAWPVNTLFSQGLRINEVMSSNRQTYFDEDQSTPDWIELYNGSAVTVNLAGFGISDNVNDPYQWIFPDMLLEPGEFLLVAASEKDRRDLPIYWETVVSASDTFRYLVPAAYPGDWRMPEFPDATWNTGRPGFGYGDGDDTTVVPFGTISLMARRNFVIGNLAQVKRLMLHMDYDDSFVAYLNGHEIARAQIGEPGIPPSWYLPATNANHEAAMYQGGNPEAFACDSAIQYLVQGNNVFAVEVHNADATSSDLSCIPFLSTGLSAKPGLPSGTPSCLKLANTLLHLNFKLNASGDTVLLTDPSGVLIDSLQTGVIPPDVSLGLKPDGLDSRFFFEDPTPGAANLTRAFPLLSFADPVFSHPGGFLSQPVDLVIAGPSPGDSVWYTTDGSVPGRSTALYTGPVRLNGSSVIRAVITGPGRMNNKPVTRSYLFRSEQPTLTTISLSSPPPNFFDWDTGIYVMGPNAASAVPHYGANFWEDWERPVHLELFEPDGTHGWETDAGIKIFGAWSRANPQRSFAFYSRSLYGDNVFRYKLFPDLPFAEYNNFLLRNSGNDWNNTMFRDAMMCSLLEQTSLDRMAYRPASVYLNGSYWGLLNMREKINEHFLASHHGLDPYQIDLLESWGNPLHGDAEHYNSMLDFLHSHSPAIQTNYDQVKTMMDVGNFIEYQVAEIYFNNTDWPGNNIKYWRPRTPDGKWRWIVYDTDFGFGIWDEDKSKYTFNTLAFALATDGPDWPNPPWSTFLLRRMLENQEFKYEFINRFADRLNTAFSYQTVLGHIDQMSRSIEHEIPFHLARWNQWGENTVTWRNNVENMRVFARNRASYMRTYISQQFANLGYVNFKLATSSSQSGIIRLNTLLLKSFPWEGVYFKNVPVRITAQPNPGFRFVRWEGPVDSPFSAATTITLRENTSVKAVFEQDGTGLDQVIINEIYFNDPPDFNADDWIELYNHGVTAVDLSGWILKDEDLSHRYVIPAGIYLYPNEYLVISRNTSNFSIAYPDRQPSIGNLSFGLGSTGDCVMLLTPDSILVDSVYYGIADPWPQEPVTEGVSLELLHPDFDNSMPGNWMASVSPHGTPGADNAFFTGTEPPDPGEENNGLSLQIFPNPFSDFARIRYEVTEPQRIRLSVYDMQGQLVSTLFQGETDPGIKEMVWDGSGTNGSLLQPGIYVCSLETGNNTVRCRVVIIRQGGS